jgi:hypothetical protein
LGGGERGVVSLAISNAGQVQGLISGPIILLLVKMFISEDTNFFIYNNFKKSLKWQSYSDEDKGRGPPYKSELPHSYFTTKI